MLVSFFVCLSFACLSFACLRLSVLLGSVLLGSVSHVSVLPISAFKLSHDDCFPLSVFSPFTFFFFKQDSPCLSMFFTFRCQKHVSLVLRVSMTTFLKNDETQRIHRLRGSVFYVSMPEICFACLSLFLMSQCLKDVLRVSYLKGNKIS